MQSLLEKFRHSDIDIIALRVGVIAVFLVFGLYKWFEFEVQALEPLISATWLNILYLLFGVHGGSYFLGIVEGIVYITLIIGFFNPKPALLGDILTVITGITTLSLLPQNGMDGFIFKDILLIGAGLVLFKYDLNKIRQ